MGAGRGGLLMLSSIFLLSFNSVSWWFDTVGHRLDFLWTSCMYARSHILCEGRDNVCSLNSKFSIFMSTFHK